MRSLAFRVLFNAFDLTEKFELILIPLSLKLLVLREWHLEEIKDFRRPKQTIVYDFLTVLFKSPNLLK